MINYHLTISGLVQGVGFRWSCYRLAQRMGVTGFVRNLPNGQVYVEVQGAPTIITEFIKQLATGPSPYARVSSLQKENGQIQDYGNTFTIRR